MPVKARPPVDRFWPKVDSGDGCWIWTGAVRSSGYGNFSVGGGRFVSPHRFSYELANGTIGEGLIICHRCDNRLCVRPDHLFAATHKDNYDDMDAKGRRVKKSVGHRYLTADEAASLPLMRMDGKSLREIATELGVTPGAISHRFAKTRRTLALVAAER